MKYDASLQTIAWLNGRRTDRTLVISPKFQRRAVWLDAERSALIETVVSSLPFPEIYIQHRTNPESGSEQHIVVDGQQRVTSLLMFIDNRISLPVNHDWKGQYFSDLTPEQKEAFWDYKIVVRGLSQTNEAEIRDLFTRLNTNNVSLNDQELRNARYRGRFKNVAERMADALAVPNIGLFTARDIRRMLDVEFASELLLLTVEGITNKKDMIDEAYGRFEEEFPGEAEYEADFNASLSLLLSIQDDSNLSTIRRKSNFFSLYGACLRYHRKYKRMAFQNPKRIAGAVAELLNFTLDPDRPTKPSVFVEYFDAVSRAASDRARRATREDILFGLIEANDLP